MDARIIRTKRDLSIAFLNLLDEKDYDSIKVVDICKKAMISKVTFYNNFKCKSDLLNYILLGLEEEIKKKIYEVSSSLETKKDLLLNILKISYKEIIEQKDILKKIIFKKSTSSLLIDLRNFINQEILKNIDSLKIDEKSSIPKNYFAAFYSGAIVSILPMVVNSADSGELDEDSLVKLFAPWYNIKVNFKG